MLRKFCTHTTPGIITLLPRFFPPTFVLRKEDCDLHPDRAFHSRYRGIVGSLGYLVNMTPSDVAFAYSELNKYVQFPGKLHIMAAADHVLRYLRGTYEKGILFSRGIKQVNILWGSGSMLIGTVTPIHADLIPVLSSCLMADQSAGSHVDSISSLFRLECMAASEGGKEVVYIRAILQDFGFTQKGSTNLYEDNLAAVTMSTNAVRRKYSRHIDIRRHYVRELALAGVIKLVPLGTHDMVADALTKSLPVPRVLDLY